MTALAIKQLSANDQGYFCWWKDVSNAHHLSNAYRALADTVALSEAVQWVVDNVNLEQTLIIVTADHSHTMTMSGYLAGGTRFWVQ